MGRWRRCRRVRFRSHWLDEDYVRALEYGMPPAAVAADSLARRRRHAVLERSDVVLVEPVRLGVAAREELPLLAEAGELVDRVVQLAVRVGQLAPSDKELEPVHEGGVVALLFGGAAQPGGGVHDERGLHQRGLD